MDVGKVLIVAVEAVATLGLGWVLSHLNRPTWLTTRRSWALLAACFVVVVAVQLAAGDDGDEDELRLAADEATTSTTTTTTTTSSSTSSMSAPEPSTTTAPTASTSTTSPSNPAVSCVTAYDHGEPLESQKNHLGPDGFLEETVKLREHRMIRRISAQVYRLTDQGHDLDAAIPPSNADQLVRLELRSGERLLGSKNFVTSVEQPVEWTLTEAIDARPYDFVALRVVNESDWSLHVSWVGGNPYVFGELVSTSGPRANYDLGARIEACDD